MGKLNDLSLATQVAVFHNRRAFDRLVREYQSPVRRFLLLQTGGNEALSDDLAQDTFLKAYTHIAQYRGQSSLLTWLTRIAYNVWYDYRRRHTIVADGTLPEAVQPAASSVAGLSIDVQRALAVLRDEERTCITLQLVDGYQIDEIAAITDIPVNTVKSHLRRGKEKLTDYLRKNGYDR